MTVVSNGEAAATGPHERQPASPLERLMNPTTIAVVGLSDKSPVAEFIAPTLNSAAEVFFVHPKAETVLGRAVYRSIGEVPARLDAVLSVMSAERTVALAEECSTLDCGGLVVYAAGFSELGAEGADYQARLVDAAQRGNMAVVGPNSLGYISMPRSLHLTASADYHPAPGGISIVSHSGAMIGGIAIAARQRTGVGIARLISAGNEATTDIADYLDFLATDADTTAIGLVVEGIRRPAEFFAAARRCIAAGKPIVALKLARNARTQQMAASHTGALAGNAWAYDVTFRHAGIQLAYDLDELVDRLSVVSQVDPGLWNPVQRIGVVAGTGGFASLAFDVAEEEGLTLPPLDSLADWVTATIPGITVPNPLDTTGFGATFWTDIVERYVGSEDLDAVVFVNMWSDSPLYHRLIADVAAAARRHRKPVAIAAGAGEVGDFALDVIGDDGAVALGYGIRGTLRGLHALRTFVRDRETLAGPAEAPAPIPCPTTPVSDAAGTRFLPFRAVMELLGQFGIPTAPYVVLDDDLGESDIVTPAFAGPYAVKLADVAHRTELGAVALNVDASELSRTVARMRDIATRNGVAAAVAVQPMTTSRGELLIGVDGRSELGPMVMLGLGGVFVEVLQRVGGRPAPLTKSDAEALIEEFRDLRLLHGFRGAQPWHLDQLADILVGLGNLAAAGHDWIESLDVNPLLVTTDGLAAVDALCIVRD